MKTHYRPSFLLRPRRWLNTLVATLFFAEMSLPSVSLAGGITAAPGGGANRPTVDTSGNGVPVINIVRPDGKGVSHNKYQDFNVPGQGAILNNSGKETQTRLAGWIDKNSGFAPGDSARLILNEVTGPDISRLAGYLEVAGNRADVIIANPNGIHGSNFGFINTSRALLTTGRPEFDAAGDLRSFAVTGGKVTIDGDPGGANPDLGAYAGLTDQFDILARAIEINAQVHAQKLNLVTGANRVDYNDLAAKKIAADPAGPAPLVALDVAALGGMYAGRIRLVGTEAGLGVNLHGAVAAGAGGFTLTSEGKVVINGQATSDAALAIDARDGIQNTGVIHAAGNATLTAGGPAMPGDSAFQNPHAGIQNTGHLSSAADLALHAAGPVNSTGVLAAGLTADGRLAPGAGALTVTAGAGLAATGGNYAGRAIAFTAGSIDLDGAFTQAPSVTLAATAGGISHRDATLSAGALAATATAGGAGETGGFDNTGGQILATGGIGLALAGGLDNTGGEIQSGGGLSLLAPRASLINTAGLIASGSTLAIAAAALDNTAGQINAAGPATLALANGVGNTGGKILSAGDLRITNAASPFDNTGGLIQTDGALTIDALQSALASAAGGILSAGALDLRARSLDNTAGLIGANADLALTLTEALGNTAGEIISGRDATLAAASLDNTGGAIDAARALAITLAPPAPQPPGTPALLNNTDGTLLARAGALTVAAAALDNTRGLIATGSANLALALDGAFTNTGGGLSAAAGLSLTAASLANLGGALTSGGAMTLTATAGGIASTGEILAGGPLAITAAGALASTGANALIGANSTLTLTAASLDNTGVINAARDLAITVDGLAANTNGGAIATAAALALDAAALDNADGEILAGGVAAITLTGTGAAGGLDNTRGAIAAGGALTIENRESKIENRLGEISAAGSLALAAATLDNTAGLVGSGGLLDIAVDTNLLNAGGAITAAGALAIDAGGTVASTGAGAFIGTNSTLSLAAAALENTGVINAGRDLALTVAGAAANTGGGVIATAAALSLDAASLDNTAGEILAGGAAAILLAPASSRPGPFLDNTRGLITAGGGLDLRAGGALDNTAGEISASGSLALAAAALDNTAGLVSSGLAATLALTGDLLNADGAITAGGDLALALGGTLLSTGSGALIGTNAALAIDAAALENSGLVTAKNAARITLAGGLGNTGGAIASGSSLTLSAAGLDNAGGGMTAAADMTLAIGAAGLDNTRGHIVAGDSLGISATASPVQNRDGIIAAGAGSLAIAAKDIANAGGRITAADALAIDAASLDNTAAGAIYSGGGARIALTGPAGGLDNSRGSLQTAGALGLALDGTLDNTLGEILANGVISIAHRDSVPGGGGGLAVVNRGGFIGGNAAFALTAASLDNTGGAVTFNGDVALTLAGALVNTGTAALLAGGGLTLAAASVDNRAGIVKAAGGITAALAGAWDNAGGILAAGAGGLALAAAGLDNRAGAVATTGTLTLALSGTMENSSGQISADSAATLAAAAINNAGGAITANDTLALTLTAGPLDNTAGQISAGGALSIRNSRSEIQNRRGVIVAGGIDIAAAALDNSAAGYIGSGGTLAIALSGAAGEAGAAGRAGGLDNSAGGAILAAGAIAITAASLDNRDSGVDGGIFGNSTLAITTTTGGIANAAGSITALGGLAIATAAGLDNTAGAIQSAAALSIANAGPAALDNTRGAITASGPLAIENRESKIENSAGLIAASGGATLAAARIANTGSGLIQSAGALSLTAAGGIDNAAGQILAAGDAALAFGSDASAILNPQSALDNTGGLIQSAAALSITNASASALDNTRGVITASGPLTIENRESKIENSAGLIATGSAGDLTLNLKALAAGAGGSIIAGRDLALTLAAGDFTLDGAREFWANGNLSLTLQNGAFTNTGTGLAAYGLFTIDAARGITNRAGALLYAGGLRLVTTGTLLNLGRIDADYINATADVIQNRSIIIGGIVSLDARELYNTGAAALVAATDFLGLYTSGLLSNTRDAAAVAASGSAGPFAAGATIFTTGNLVIAGRGGLDETGSPVARAGRVENLSSTIEASGNAVVAADVFENKKDTFATEMYLSATEVFNQSHLDTTHEFSANKQSQDGRLYEGLSYYRSRDENSTWLEYTKRTYNTRITKDSPEARMLVTGNLTISTGRLTNYVSTMAAGGYLYYHDTGVVENISGSNTRRIVHGDNGTVDVYELDKKPQTFGSDKYERKFTGAWFIPDEVTDIADPRFSARITAGDTITGSVAELYNGEAAKRPVLTAHDNLDTSVSGPILDPVTGADGIRGHETTDNTAATGGAGNSGTLDAPAGGHDTGVGEVDAGSGHAAGVTGVETPSARPPVAPPAGDGSGGVIPGGKTLPGFTITAPGEVVFTAPQNPLYTVATAPDSPYLVVTDPRFTNWDNFISSDYFFQKLQSDPQAVHKRLGDGFYENRLILDQITALTGRRFLGDYRAEDEQFMALMDNALAVAESWNLRPGVALTPEQIDSLETDIVWLVETLVNGQTVLAPVVYLSQATRAQIENGAVIAARDIDLEITGGAVNTGVIRADRDMRLQAATLLNDGGALKTGGDMVLVAKTDITSRAGAITAGGNASLVAGRDILLASVADTTDYSAQPVVRIVPKLGGSPVEVTPGATATHTIVRGQTLAAGGDLVLQAGRDLTLTGVGVTAGGDAALLATRDLTLDTVRAVSSFSTGDTRNYIRTEQITNTLTTLDVAGGLALRAGDFSLLTPAAADPASTPNLNLNSDAPGIGNISITSAQLRAGGDLTLAATGGIDITAVKDRDFSDIRSQGKKRMDRALHDDETVLGATLQSGGNLALQAGDVTQTSKSADGEAAQTSTSNINLTSAYLTAAGALTAAAAGDITLTTLDEHHEEIIESMRKKSGALSTKTTTTYDRVDYTGAVGATLSGESVAVHAGRDLNIQGSTVVADNDILLKAASGINITAAAETYSEEHYKEVKKSGVLSNGAIGFTVGKQKQSTEIGIEAATAGASMLGSSGGRVDLLAGGDVRVAGGELLAGSGLSIDAANIGITAAEQSMTRTRTDKFSQSGVSVALRGGWADMVYAEQGRQMRGGAVVEDERVQGFNKILNAAGAINSDGVQAGGASFAVMTVAAGYGSKSSETTSSETAVTHLGSTLQSGGDLTLVARGAGSGGTGDPPVGGGDITIEGSHLSAGGALAAVAARDIAILESLDTLDTQSAGRSKQGDVTGHAAATDASASAQSAAAGSLLTGETVTLLAGRDLGVRGSTVAADNDILLSAGRDVSITAATETQAGDASHRVSKSGLFDSGQISVTVGSQKQAFSQEQTDTYAAGSLIGSTAGRVDIVAGGGATIVGSELFSQTGLSIEADRISILAAEQTSEGRFSQNFSQGGLTVRLQGGLVDAGLGLINTIERAEQADDDRLKGLYAARAARQAYQLYQGAQGVAGAPGAFQDSVDAAAASGQAAPEGSKAGAAGAASGIELAIAVGAKSSHAENEWEGASYLGSKLDTAGDLTLTARGDAWNAGGPPAGSASGPDAGLETSGGGGIHIAGSDLTAQNVTLAAANNLTIESALDAHRQDGSNKNSGWEGGVALSLGQGGVGIKIFADAEAGKGSEKGDGAENLNSHVTAAENLTVTTGRDAVVAGAVLTGGSVKLDIGGGLTLESRQDTDTYESKQQQISGGASFTIGSMSGEAHGSVSLGNTDSNYASVVEQTGIHAGQGGFDINVGGHTQLTGAVIASEAEAAQNKLTTQTIGFTDLQNHSEYDAKSISINASSGGGVGGGMSHQSDSDSGVTRSAVAAGDITVRADFDAGGNRLADSMEGLSRDTANANGSVENTFDRQKLAKQQELAQLAGEVGFQAVGDLSKYLSRDAKAQSQAADTLEKAAQVGAEDRQALLDTASELRDQAAPALAAWDDGGYAKILLHAGVGALQASLGGGDALSGALGAGVAEAGRGINIAGHILGTDNTRDANGNKTNTTKAIEQLFSTAVGSAAGAVGGDAMTGGGVAWDAEKYNRQLHDDEIAAIKAKAREKAAAEMGTQTGREDLLKITNAIQEANPSLSPEEADRLAKVQYEASYEARYMLAGMNLVHAGAEVPRWMMRLGAVTRQLSALGGDYTAEQADLKSTGLFQYDATIDGAADLIASGRASFDNYKTYVLVPGALPEDGLVGAYKSNTLSLAIEAAYNREESGGYHNAQRALDLYITPLVGATYENPSKVFEALGKDSKARWVRSIAGDMLVDTGVHIGETLGHTGANIQLTESGGNPLSVDSYRENVQNINMAARSLEDPLGKAGEYELDDPDIKAAKFLGEVAITIAGPAAIGKVGNLVWLSKEATSTRILANIAESQAARAASKFEIFAANEAIAAGNGAGRIPVAFADELKGGGSWLMTEEQYKLHILGKEMIGRADGQFMISSLRMNELLIETGENTAMLAERLGAKWAADAKLIRIDVTDPLKYNPRLPVSNMSGVNSLFVPGGKTIGGVPEITTDMLPQSEIWTTPVIKFPAK